MSKPIEELVAMRGAITDKMAGLKSELSDVDAAITHLALPLMTDKLNTLKKVHGSYKLSVDGFPIQGEIRKTVKWDSEKLKEVAGKISAEDAVCIFTVTLSITEKQMEDLEAMEHPAVGEILLARTVNFSAFSAKPA